MFFIMMIIILITNAGGRPASGLTPGVTAGFSIPIEELFFPVEPDFIPEFLLEREPRRFWSLEDIRQYWRVPGETELWRGEVRSAVDRIMEGVR